MKLGVVGLGYVGLPLSIILARNGHSILAIDRNKEKISQLSKGSIPFAKDEPKLLTTLTEQLKNKRITFDSKFKSLSEAEIIFVAVDTPIKDKKPDYGSLNLALKNISKVLSIGSVVVIESTVAPKTVVSMVIPTIEKYSKLKVNKDFFVATVPERIRPNHIFKQLTTLSRVIGVSDPKIKTLLRNVYSEITSGHLDFTDPTTAEVVKTVENTFRDVNIAFANEIALACEELGVNVWKVKELVNKSPFHNLHSPGSGVGGHCIPKDPWLLASSVKQTQLKIVNDARAINDYMPSHVFKLAKNAIENHGKKIKDSKLVILGYTYVENSDDVRNSPTIYLIKILEDKGIKFEVHDPYIEPFSKSKIESLVDKSDCLIFMVGHSAYKNLNLKKLADLMKLKVIIDGRNVVNQTEAEKAGISYFGIGNVPPK